MEYSTKQIKCILHIQELIDISNSLSKVYIEFNDKELSVDNEIERGRIYKAYCSAIYNAMDAMKCTRYIFEKSTRYNEFIDFINKEYICSDDKYCNMSNYKASFYKIIKSIRNQINHYTSEDDASSMLFEIYVDFKIIEELREMINDIFNKIFEQIDKKKIESIVLSQPKIKYTTDFINRKIDDIIEKNINLQSEDINVYASESKEAINIIKDFFDPTNLLRLYNNDDETIEMYQQMNDTIDNMREKVKQDINMNGSDQQKKAIELLDSFSEKGNRTINEYKKDFEELIKNLNKISKGNDDENPNIPI